MTLLNIHEFDAINLDARIKRSLSDAVTAVKLGGHLSLTAIGRRQGDYRQLSEKHSIKRVDRLVGHDKLSHSCVEFYQQFSLYFKYHTSLLVLVDWSTLGDISRPLLRASVAFQGRAFTLYEEVHELEKVNNHACHKRFLAQLKRVLPEGPQVIICTDAGFKVPWFKAVESLGWDWVARMRGVVMCLLENKHEWQYASTYHAQATNKPKELGNLALSKQHKHPCRGIIYKGRAVERPSSATSKRRPNCNQQKNYRKSAKEPWFLVTNVSSKTFSTSAVTALYKRRMTIEEGFRDTKNEYYGLGIARSRSTSIKRLSVLLLIAFLAQWQLYLIGKSAEMQGYHLAFQANTTKTRRVLSYCFLAQRILLHKRFKVTKMMLLAAQNALLKETVCV